ncbi:MAG TPA: YbaK/EbsC family protein [Burkholderiales bacterium]|nr:YbaK/EbsC family protein [Burkholderiales bacterium]
MSSPVLGSPSVARVREALSRFGLSAQIVELPGAARTAKAAAEYLGCDVAQIANSLVFRAETSDSAVLVMSSGARRVDTGRLAALLMEPVVKRMRSLFAAGPVS